MWNVTEGGNDVVVLNLCSRTTIKTVTILVGNENTPRIKELRIGGVWNTLL